jgi:hypothetical protein
VPLTPKLQSLLIADTVFQQKSGKWCVIGIFDRILVKQFPALHHSLGLFIVVSDAQGEYNVKVEFRNSSDQILALFEGIKLNIQDRLANVGFGVQTHNLVIPSPGKYYFKLYLNDEFLDDRLVEAVKMEPAP